MTKELDDVEMTPDVKWVSREELLSILTTLKESELDFQVRMRQSFTILREQGSLTKGTYDVLLRLLTSGSNSMEALLNCYDTSRHNNELF